MKKTLVCIALIFALSLTLAACGSVSDGTVGTSPAPVGATPALPRPSAEVSMAPIPGDTVKPRTDSDLKPDAAQASASPAPTSERK